MSQEQQLPPSTKPPPNPPVGVEQLKGAPVTLGILIAVGSALMVVLVAIYTMVRDVEKSVQQVKESLVKIEGQLARADDRIVAFQASVDSVSKQLDALAPRRIPTPAPAPTP